MNSQEAFTRQLAELDLTHADRAIAFLWYYTQTQEYEERTAAELSSDLHDEGFPKPQVYKLKIALTKSRLVTRGSRTGTFQLDIRHRKILDEKYLELLGVKITRVSGHILNPDLVAGTRGYLERIVHQINGSYEFGFYDATAVLLRRIMESLLIEIYIHEKRTAEIRTGGAFLQLERLISFIRIDPKITLSRNAPKNMIEIKQLGDTAAHDRTYITQQNDIDDIKAKSRRLIQELLTQSGIKT